MMQKSLIALEQLTTVLLEVAFQTVNKVVRLNYVNFYFLLVAYDLYRSIK